MRFTLLIALMLWPALAAAQVYRWVDDDGVVHYSDQPAGGGAERAELPSLQMADPVESTGGEDGNRPRPGPAPGLTLMRPAPEATFRDARGLIPVSVALDGPLTPDQSLVYYLDGQAVGGSPTRKTSLQLEGVSRGPHRLAVALMRGDREIARTGPVTVYMQPPSAIGPTSGRGSDDGEPPPGGAPASPPSGPAGGAPSAPRLNSGP